MNRIIFGGAFDPIHNGHLNMAEKAMKALDGEVILVPARISVWKDKSAPIDDKIAMIELAIKGKKGFSIEKYEINSESETTYSIDTINYLLDKYPNDKLYLLIGLDQVNEFHRWKAADEIAKKVQIIYYSRPNYNLENENVQRFRMQEIKGEMVDVSSTNIRELKEFNLPESVLFYIVENDLYEGMGLLLSMLTPHRLKHSKSVAKTAYEIAKANHVDNPLDYYIAGLFHDIGKDISIEKQYELVKKHFPEYIDMPNFSYHQFAGAILAKNLVKVTNQDILDSIEFHSTGSEKMSKMAKTIYAADKIEPTRGFDSSDLISEMKKDIDQGFKIVLQANKDFLESKGKMTDNPLTYNCFKTYLQ